MKLAGAVFVDRPVEKVFARLADLERSPEWSVDFGVIERSKLTDGPTGVGTRFRAVDQLLDRRNEYEVEITAYEQNRYLAAAWSEPIGGGWQARFEESDGGTNLTFVGEMEPTGVLKLLAPLMGLWGKRATRRDLDRFKRWVETGSE